MWDVLGVLAFRVAAALNRGVPRLEASVHRDRLPHRAAFAFGGPIVPVSAPTLPRPRSLLDALARWLRAAWAEVESLGRAARARRRVRLAARRAADERELAREMAETRPLRVPIVANDPPLAPAVARLAALVLVGAVAASVLVVALGGIAVRAIENFLR